MKFLVIITSTIFHSQKPLSYSDTRSVFSFEERILQTLHTIDSVRKKIPNATIVVLETGTDSVEVIKERVDHYVFLGDKKLIRYVCDGPFKGLGEIIGILFYKKFLTKQDYQVCFKISGRYYINDNFSLDYYHQEKFSFVLSSDRQSFSTRLYMVPKKLETYYIRILYVSIPLLLIGLGIEHVFKKIIPDKKVNMVERIGVSGCIAPTGEFSEE